MFWTKDLSGIMITCSKLAGCIECTEKCESFWTLLGNGTRLCVSDLSDVGAGILDFVRNGTGCPDLPRYLASTPAWLMVAAGGTAVFLLTGWITCWIKKRQTDDQLEATRILIRGRYGHAQQYGICNPNTVAGTDNNFEMIELQAPEELPPPPPPPPAPAPAPVVRYDRRGSDDGGERAVVSVDDPGQRRAQHFSIFQRTTTIGSDGQRQIQEMRF